MLFSAEWEKFIWEGSVFLTFVLICGALIKRRFSKTASLLAAVGTVAGVCLLQTVLLLSGQEPTLVLTMLPITAYLPVVICLHILSCSSFFQTMAAWTMGTVAYFVLKTLWKILIPCFRTFTNLPGWGAALLITTCVLLAAAFLIFLVYRFLRRPFQTYVLENKTNWLLLSFPVLMVFLVFSYVGSSTTDSALLVLLLLTACSIFLVLIRVLTSAAAITRLQAAEEALSVQMQMQRGEYEDICKRMELGRTYRHDMRHHLMALGGLAKRGDTEGVSRYLGNLNSQLASLEKETYCENSAINAVLASYIGKAKEAHCAVTASIHLPGEIPMDEMDVCMVLANALENAVNACREIDKESRYILLKAELAEGRKLTVSVQNPCKTPLSFDADGFPIVPKREGHGIGLKSIDAITRKYQGVFRYECQDGEFQFRAVLFGRQHAGASSAKPERQARRLPKQLASSALLSVLLFVVMVNCMPAMAQTLTEVPVFGPLVRLVDIRSYRFQWGDTSFTAELPVLDAQAAADYNGTHEQPRESVSTGSRTTNPPEPAESNSSSSQPLSQAETSSSGTAMEKTGTAASSPSVSAKPTTPSLPPPEESRTTRPTTISKPAAPSTSSPTQPTSPSGTDSGEEEDINQKIEDYIAQMQEKFLWYVARKYEGYVGMDTTYRILHNDSRLLSVRFETTLNVGGSAQYSRSFTLDKQTGEVLELWDLFEPNSNYIGVISQEILKQMAQRVEAGEGDYFIPGGIWSEDECFKKIDADQNFYINADSQLVIVFDEYEVAPGSMGMPEFIIETEKLKDILRQPPLLG